MHETFGGFGLSLPCCHHETVKDGSGKYGAGLWIQQIKECPKTKDGEQ